MTRKTSRKVSMKGKRSQDMLSARMRRASETGGAGVALRRTEASVKIGRMNSSEMTVSKEMQPKTATILEMRFCQSMRAVRGYSSS